MSDLQASHLSKNFSIDKEQQQKKKTFFLSIHSKYIQKIPQEIAKFWCVDSPS